ncbi:MAG: protein kinase [Bdellovibrionales bacterium]|nr:protein kinase [Bdellovibrionales bacterium]
MMEHVRSQTTTNYHLISLIGEGLTSRVYKAIRKHEDLRVEQIVALKVLKSNKLVPTLKTEIDLLTRVQSQHCVRMLGWEKLPQGWTLVLEYLEGVTLADLYALVRIEHPIAMEIIAQVQQGLKDLASYDLRHGDLTPQNIFITLNGCVKLLDFGFSDVQSHHGQPQFVSPEFWREQSLSQKSDLFSLGLIYKDLKDRNLLTSKTNEDWRQRAFEIDADNSLLHQSPEKRNYLEVGSNMFFQKKLAELVARAVYIQKHQGRTLRIHEDSERSSPIKYLKCLSQAVCFVASLFFTKDIKTTVLSAATQSPVYSREKSPPALASPLSLSVRSRFWAKAALYQCESRCEIMFTEKFTPLVWKNLTPGNYEVHWRQGREIRKISVQLQKNQLILLKK